MYKGYRMVTANETHQPGTEKKKIERKKERQKKKRDREKRSGESEVPRSDQSSQAFRVTKSGSILPTLLWDYMLLSSRTEYRLDRDGIYIVRFTGQAISIWLFLM